MGLGEISSVLTVFSSRCASAFRMEVWSRRAELLGRSGQGTDWKGLMGHLGRCEDRTERPKAKLRAACHLKEG